MLFSTPIFVFLFLPVSLVGFYLIAPRFGPRAFLGWLGACSIFFYANWRLEYLPVLLGSILVNFFVASQIQKRVAEPDIPLGGRRAAWWFLMAGLMFNLGLLGIFKYLGFFTEVVNQVAGTNFTVHNYLLPLAISFFTFQQITYLVDSRRGIVAGHGFLKYLVFVTFFPQLIAGPIVHHSEMMPQFASRLTGILRWKNLYIGFVIFSIGLFKKVVIADALSIYVEEGFAAHSDMTILDAWVTTLSYTFQLYFDFSGYSDMAIGAARMFGIKLPLNFLSPYKSTSIQVFWRRWHITLSRFLRDYIYIPLGGNRKKELGIAANLLTTFLLGGLWHGAGWTFLIWGAIHGTGLVISRAFGLLGLSVPRLVGWVLTFFLVHVAWVFFRSDSVPQALDILSLMFGFVESDPATSSHVVLSDPDTAVRLVVTAMVAAFFLPNTTQFVSNLHPMYKTLAISIMFAWACLTMMTTRSEVFLYFNF